MTEKYQRQSISMYRYLYCSTKNIFKYCNNTFSIIKSTLQMFVNYTKENLQNEFVKKMLHKENFESIMQEDTNFYKEHNKLVEKKKVSIISAIGNQ